MYANLPNKLLFYYRKYVIDWLIFQSECNFKAFFGAFKLNKNKTTLFYQKSL